MFDRFLIREDSLHNVTENDKIIGFKFAVRIADYRGCILSLHNGYYIACDGIEYPKSVQKFEVNQKPPRDFEEIKNCVWEHWNYDDEAYVHVSKEGGLTPGKHEIKLQQSILAQYGYMPWDEEWLKNPPVPGSGAGSGKTAAICSFTLELQEGGH